MNRAQVREAPVGLLPPARPLMTGEVVDAAFRLFRASLLRSLPYSGLAVLALQISEVHAMFFGSSDDSFGIPVSDRQIVFVIGLLVCTLLIGVITLRLHAISRGVRPRFRTEIATAFRRWPASIIATLAGVGLPLMVVVLWTMFRMTLPGTAQLVVMLVMLWVTAMLIAVLPAFWCDGLGPIAAIVRTVRIAVRRTWRMVGAILATGCIVMVFYMVAAVVVFMLGPLVGRADLFLLSTLTSLVWLVAGALGMPFVLAMLVVAYEDLKLRELERRGAAA